MPALAAEIGPMSHDEARIRLNQETGLNVLPDDLVWVGHEQHLEALKALKAEVGGFGPHIKNMGTPITGPVQIYEDNFPNS